MSESKANAAIRAEKQKKSEKVAGMIKEVLESNQMALQPFLSFSEHGVVPRVRLVEAQIPQVEQEEKDSSDNNESNVEQRDTNDEGGDSPEAGEGEVNADTVEPE